MQHNDILDDFDFGDNLYFEEKSGEVVAKFYSAMEAEVAAARLRSEGIPCFLANSTSQTVLPHVQGLIRLHVRPAQVDQARTILAEAAIDTNDSPSVKKDHSILLILAVLIGLLLAILLVRAMWGIY